MAISKNNFGEKWLESKVDSGGGRACWKEMDKEYHKDVSHEDC